MVSLFAPRVSWAFPSSRLIYARELGLQCPDEQALRHAVAARLGYDPFFPWADRTISAEIAREGDHLAGSVKLLDASGVVQGRRQLRAPLTDCAELLRAMTLAISIAIDPESIDEARAPPEETEAPAPARADPPVAATPLRPPPAPVDTLPTLPIAPPSDARRVTPLLRAGPVATVGSTPALAWGGTIGAGARWSQTSLEIEGRALWPATTQTASRGVQSSMLVATMLPCLRLVVGFACARLGAGVLFARGTDMVNAHTQSAPYFAAGATVGREIGLGRTTAIVAHLDVEAPLTRTVLAFQGVSVWRAPAASASLGAAFQLLL